MSFVRPEVARHLSRWREVIAGVAAVCFGIWLASFGGPVMLGLGGAWAAVFAALTVLAFRRMRFHLDVEAPGVVEIDEARISYMGPIMGGSVDLRELVRIEVIDVAGGRRCWRLQQSDGQALLVPLAAAGADCLYDHFATLPGASAASLASALQGEATVARTVWRLPPVGGGVSPR